MRCCQRKTLLCRSSILVQNDHPRQSGAVPLFLCLLPHEFHLQTETWIVKTQRMLWWQTKHGNNVKGQYIQTHVMTIPNPTPGCLIFKHSNQNGKLKPCKAKWKRFNQPFMFMSCISRSTSSLINCAFEEAKSKSVSNLRVADGTLATISWPLLRFLRRRAPEVFKKKHKYKSPWFSLVDYLNPEKEKILICHCFTTLSSSGWCWPVFIVLLQTFMLSTGHTWAWLHFNTKTFTLTLKKMIDWHVESPEHPTQGFKSVKTI